MQISIKSTRYPLSKDVEEVVEEKLKAPLRLLGEDSKRALLDIELEGAPPEGRSSEPCRLVARLSVDGEVYRAEVVKPTPATAADRARGDLEAAIRHSRGRTRRLLRRGASAIKGMLRFGRQ